MYGVDISYIIIALAAVCVVLFILVLVLFGKMSKLTKKYNAFMAGEDAASLEDQITANFQEMKKIKLKQEQQDLDILEISDRVDESLQNFGVVKYNAFDDLGGNLSFAIAVINDKKNGFTLNCMQSNHGSYVYAKRIERGVCDVEMSGEEEEALKIALK